MSTENAIANMVGTVTQQMALVDQGSYEELFPVMAQPAKQERFVGDTKQLDGQKEITGIYIGHRLGVIQYPENYVKELGPKGQPDPVGGAAIPGTSEYASLAKSAVAAAQFTKKDLRDKFNVSAGGPGIFKASLEILVYNAVIDDFVVVRSWNGYNGVFARGAALDSLLSNVDADGVIPPVPYCIAGRVEIGFGQAENALFSVTAAEDEDCVTGFAAVVEQNDGALHDRLSKWLKCEDNPLGDKLIADMEAAVSMKG